MIQNNKKDEDKIRWRYLCESIDRVSFGVIIQSNYQNSTIPSRKFVLGLFST